MKILVVEDEPNLNNEICSYLDNERFECVGVSNKFDAEDELLQSRFAIVLLDINLPDGTGLELLEWMRSERMDSGVIIISARDSFDDRIVGLDSGADDYLTKPVHLPELNARVKALIRRKKFDNKASLSFGEWELKPEELVFNVNGTGIELTPKQYKIVEFLVSNPNKVVSKQMLAEYIWKGHALDRDNLEFIYNHVTNIRAMVKKAGGKDYIKTVYGTGYKLSEQ